MIALSRRVRRILDDEGLEEVKIFASGGFDEYGVSDAVAQEAPIDAFGVGTKVGVSADAPFMDMVYKLTQFETRPVRKLSESKATLGGAKQVFRRTASRTGHYVEDIIGLRDEPIGNARPLLEPRMQAGRRLVPAPFLSELRASFQDRFAKLPAAFKSLDNPAMFPVRISEGLAALQQRIP